MTIDKIRAQVKGSVWQGIAQSGVDLNTVPGDAQTRLVESITDSVLLAVNGVLEDAYQEPGKPEIDLIEEEKVIWEGRPYLSLVEFYALTTERIKLTRGLFGKEIENVELIRIQDIDVTQNLSERLFNIGDITIRSADASKPVIMLRNVSEPQKVYELLRKAWLAARKKYGLQFREQM